MSKRLFIPPHLWYLISFLPVLIATKCLNSIAIIMPSVQFRLQFGVLFPVVLLQNCDILARSIPIYTFLFLCLCDLSEFNEMVGFGGIHILN